MKKYWLFIIIVLLSCQSRKQINTTDLETIEQIDSIQGGHEENSRYWTEFNIDVPVNGPQILIDSVMTFLNKKYYYVFDKHDGHIVKEVISKENIKKFFEDYPEYCRLRGDRLLGWPDWVYDAEHIFENTDFGLGTNDLSIVINDVGRNFYFMNIPYSQILSYLTAEAQALVEGMGEAVSSTNAPRRPSQETR